MYQWRVNQIKLSLMERVLNHMERQGFEVQSIIPINSQVPAQCEVVLAGRKIVKDPPLPKHTSAPAITESDIATIYRK